jgi:hypothetical protein
MTQFGLLNSLWETLIAQIATVQQNVRSGSPFR